MTSHHRVRATGEWTILVPSEFEQICHDDSWQACSGDRIVFVSSLAITKPGGEKAPACIIHATAIGGLGKGTDGERFSFSKGVLQGAARITRQDGHWQLKGFMCTIGTVATCVIDYANEQDRDWAVSAWKSLEHP